MPRHTYKVETPDGTFTRSTERTYEYLVIGYTVRADLAAGGYWSETWCGGAVLADKAFTSWMRQRRHAPGQSYREKATGTFLYAEVRMYRVVDGELFNRGIPGATS